MIIPMSGVPLPCAPEDRLLVGVCFFPRSGEVQWSRFTIVVPATRNAFGRLPRLRPAQAPFAIAQLTARSIALKDLSHSTEKDSGLFNEELPFRERYAPSSKTLVKWTRRRNKRLNAKDETSFLE